MQNSISKQIRRPDKDIQVDIWRFLGNEEKYHSITINDISVDVDNGQVCLSGHVLNEQDYQAIEEITRSVPGVVGVHNHLVTDDDLSIQVARALSSQETTHHLLLQVYSSNGWIELQGSVPNREIQSAVEATAASVPAVRGVIQVPGIAGERNASARNPIQPRIGVRIFKMDEVSGMVYQVVITPQNRLVTYAVVRLSRGANGYKESTDYLLPVEAMDLVDLGGISLGYNTPAIHQFPGFNPANYPYAPLTWQPPYPYVVGKVRWPLLDTVETEMFTTENNKKHN